MLIKEVKTYKLSELSDEVQTEVISNWRCNDEFYNGNEIVENLKSFCDAFNLTLKDYSLGDRGENISITYHNNDIENVNGIRLWKYLNNNYSSELKEASDNECCFIANPILDFMKRPIKDYSFRDLLDDFCRNTIKVYNDELEYWYSDEAVKEDIERNDHDFTAQGKIF